MAAFMPFGNVPYGGGLSIGVGYVNGDRFADVVVAPKTAEVPLVATFDGRFLSVGVEGRLVPDFYLWDPQFRLGAELAVGDVNGDGFADIVGGPNAGPAYMRAVSGRALTVTGAPANLAEGFLWGGTANGVRFAVVDSDGDGTADVLATSGRTVARYAAPQLPGAALGATQLLPSLYGVDTGIYVG
jgi:hypothetical protein